MSITSTDMLTISCWLSIQILLGALRHKSDNSFAGAHCDVIFVGLLVMAWMGESVWVGLWVVQWEAEEDGGRIEEDDIVFPLLWPLFGADVIVEGQVIFGRPAGWYSARNSSAMSSHCTIKLLYNNNRCNKNTKTNSPIMEANMYHLKRLLPRVHPTNFVGRTGNRCSIIRRNDWKKWGGISRNSWPHPWHYCKKGWP